MLSGGSAGALAVLMHADEMTETWALLSLFFVIVVYYYFIFLNIFFCLEFGLVIFY